MASNLGNIYVQLQLDDKLYKQKLSETLGDAQATTKGLETAWKSLGVKTNQYFDDQRKAAENAYSLILKSGKYSADEIVRAEKAKNDKINAANEQQFGKQTSLISSLKTHYIAATAAIAVAIGTIGKAWSLAKEGADYKEQEGILNNLAKKYDTTADEIVSAMKKASDGMVSNADLMNIALGGLAKGLDPTQMTKLADAARLLGDTIGMSATDSLNQLATALETGRTKGLKMFMGSAIDLEDVMGDLYEKMTEAEKTQALYNMTIIEAQKLQAQMTGEVSDAGDKIEQLEAKYANLKTTVSIFAMETMVGLAEAFGLVGDKAEEAEEMVDEFGQTVDRASLSTESLASQFWNWVTGAKEAAAATAATNTENQKATDILSGMVLVGNEVMTAEEAKLAALKKTIQAREDDIKKIKEGKKEAEDAAKAAVKNAKEQGDAYIKMMSDEEKKADDFYKTLIEKRDADSKHAGEVAAATYKMLEESDAKLLAKKEADSEAYKTLISSEADFAETENERAINAIIAAHTKKISDLNKLQESGNLTYKQYIDAKTLIDKNYNAALVEQSKIAREKVLSAELAGFSTANEYAKQAYEVRIEQIEMEAEKMLELGASYESVWAYVQDKTKKAYQNMILAGDDWVEGFKVGLDKAKESMGTWASNAAQSANDFASASKTAISTTLFDFIKTGTADLKTIWTSFGDSMLKSFTDTVGAMATKFTMDFMEKIIASAASGDIVVTFKALWDTASAVVLAGIKALQSFFSYEGGYVRESGVGAYADGGMIPGYATGGDSKANDTVLSWLSPGEYVMPRTAVNAETIPYLEYMRKNKRPRYYADGGIIDPLQTYSDDYAALEEPYKNIYTSAGLYYYNGQWGLLSGWGEDDKGNAGFTTFTPVSDPVSYAGKWLNETGHYNLQDENDPPQALDQADYKYLLDWYVSANELMNTGGDWDPGSLGIRTSALTGVTDPNVIWTEPEGSGYRFYFRDGSEEFRDPSESNWLKRFMPAIIKAVGAVAAVAIATAAALPSCGTSYGLLSGLTAAIEGGMASAAALAGAAGAGLYSAFVNYGETGSVTGAIIAGIISAAATALSFGSPWAESETGLMVLKSEMAPSGYLTAAQGRVIADVIRKGGGAVLQETINSVAGGGGSMALEKSGSSGGLGEMEALYNALPGMMSGSYSLASGLDYVPYDNFPARLHKGEAVLTAEENKSGRGDIILNFNLNGTVIDRKAVNEFAELIYPRLQKLQAWGH